MISSNNSFYLLWAYFNYFLMNSCTSKIIACIDNMLTFEPFVLTIIFETGWTFNDCNIKIYIISKQSHLNSVL